MKMITSNNNKKLKLKKEKENDYFSYTLRRRIAAVFPGKMTTGSRYGFKHLPFHVLKYNVTIGRGQILWLDLRTFHCVLSLV